MRRKNSYIKIILGLCLLNISMLPLNAMEEAKSKRSGDQEYLTCKDGRAFRESQAFNRTWYSDYLNSFNSSKKINEILVGMDSRIYILENRKIFFSDYYFTPSEKTSGSIVGGPRVQALLKGIFSDHKFNKSKSDSEYKLKSWDYLSGKGGYEMKYINSEGNNIKITLGTTGQSHQRLTDSKGITRSIYVGTADSNNYSAIDSFPIKTYCPPGQDYIYRKIALWIVFNNTYDEFGNPISDLEKQTKFDLNSPVLLQVTTLALKVDVPAAKDREYNQPSL